RADRDTGQPLSTCRAHPLPWRRHSVMLAPSLTPIRHGHSMRTPADIAQHLQDDLRRSADTLAELHGSVEQRVRNPVSRAAQRTAMDELDALRTLLDDPWFGYVEVEEDG